MSSIKSFKPVQVNLGYSRTLLLYGLFVHSVPILALFSVAAEYPAVVLLLPIIVVHFSRFYHLHVASALEESVVALKWNGLPRWQLVLRNGTQVKEPLCEPVFVTSFLIILAFKRQDKVFRRVVLLTRDRINSEDYHRLQVRLITSLATNPSGNM